MNKDIHKNLGPKQRVLNIDDALAAVRKVHPVVRMEGSAGPERSFWVGAFLVAHAWPVRGCTDFWLRISQVGIPV